MSFVTPEGTRFGTEKGLEQEADRLLEAAFAPRPTPHEKPKERIQTVNAALRAKGILTTSKQKIAHAVEAKGLNDVRGGAFHCPACIDREIGHGSDAKSYYDGAPDEQG